MPPIQTIRNTIDDLDESQFRSYKQYRLRTETDE
jgi:hypothetical protein